MAKRRRRVTVQAGASTSRTYPLDVLLWLSFLVLVFSLGCFLNRDMDIWWHLRAGNDILRTGSLPRLDEYTFAAQGRPWIDLHWLFEIAMALLYRVGGSPLLTLAAATAATVAVAVLTAGYRIPGRFGLTLACWLLPVLLMSGRFYVRPEVWTLVMLAVYMVVGAQWSRRPGLVWLLVPLQVIWCNFQGLFVLGYVVAGAFAFELCCQTLYRDRRLPPWYFWAGLLALGAAGFVNPYGIKGFTFPLVLFSRLGQEHDFYGAHIAELLSIPAFIERNGVRNPYLVIHLLLIVLVSLSFLLPVLRWRFSPAMLLLWIGFAWLGWRATRNSGLYAAMAGCVLVQNLRLYFGDQRPGGGGVRIALTRLAGVMFCVLGTIGVLSGAWYEFAGEGRLVGLGEHPFWHGHDEARFAADTHMPKYIAAYHEGQAALLEFYMPPEKRVWCDPRLEVIPRQEMERYYEFADRLQAGDRSWRQFLARLPEPLLLLLDHEGHAAAEATLLAAPDWVCAVFGDVAGVYMTAREAQRRGVRPVRFGARYYALDRAVPLPSWLPGEVKRAEHAVQIGRALLERPTSSTSTAIAMLLLARAHAERAEQQGLSSFRALRARGMAALHLGTLEIGDRADVGAGIPDPVRCRWLVRARLELEKAFALNPDDFVTLTYLFHARRLLGDLESAAGLARKLLEWEPHSPQQKVLLPPLQATARSLLERVDQREGRISEDADSLQNLYATARRHVENGNFSLVQRLMRSFFDPDRGGVPRFSWEVADLFASVALVRGDVATARRLWLAQVENARPGVLAARLASTWFVAGDYRAAAERFVEGLDGGKGSAECALGLAWCATLERAPERVIEVLGDPDRFPGGRMRDVAQALLVLAREGLATE